MNYYIGLDLGTSGLKGLLVDNKGKIIREESESYAVSYPQTGWSEQKPEDWFNAAMCVVQRLSQGNGNIKGLSIGGQMHGLVMLDEKDRVIRPCILWNDGRTEKETKFLNSLPVAEYTGNIAFAGFTAPKILWVKNNEPENFRRTAKIMLPKDYLVYKLTGAFSTDYSDASGTLLLDVKNKRWSKKMLNICGICRRQLPKLYESYEKVGVLKEEIAKELGWNNVAVIAGAGDNAAAAIGTGTIYDGDCNISLGTSGTLFVASDAFRLPENNALHSFAHANGSYHLMGCILSAASANKWWIEDMLGANYDLPEKAEDKLGKNDVFFLPYLSGERCPHNDVNARGAFIGLSANTAKEDMALAVLEGVSFALRDCLELTKVSGLNITNATICGGGAKSALWKKIISNVLNVELQTVETEQGPAYGAAMLAMIACGEYDSLRDAVQAIIKKKTVVVPDKKLVSLYSERYVEYKKIYPVLKQWYRERI